MSKSEAEAKTAEHRARVLLDRMGVEGAMEFTAGDLVEIANLISEIDRLRARRAKRLEWTQTHPGMWAADSPIWRFCIESDYDGFIVKNVPPGWGDFSHSDTLQEAKEACQQHFDKVYASMGEPDEQV